MGQIRITVHLAGEEKISNPYPGKEQGMIYIILLTILLHFDTIQEFILLQNDGRKMKSTFLSIF